MTIATGPPVPSAGGAGAGDAFVALYERELGLQVRRAALLVGSQETAHDLVHDAFVELYRRWDDVRDPGPYLGRAVLNRCRDHARRASTRARRLPLLIDRGDPEDEVLWDALNELPFNHRAALVLRYYHQLSDREIAAVIGCRPGSVGPWIQRGLKRLRKDLS
jgi:RNA polymerase sigma factor (sigma-70 family)